MRNLDTDTAVELWNEMFINTANRHAPIKKNRVKGIETPWMTSDLSSAIHRIHKYGGRAGGPGVEHETKAF